MTLLKRCSAKSAYNIPLVLCIHTPLHRFLLSIQYTGAVCSRANVEYHTGTMALEFTERGLLAIDLETIGIRLAPARAPNPKEVSCKTYLPNNLHASDLSWIAGLHIAPCAQSHHQTLH